ncbi:hypothetical protein [Chondromyces crocatus]|uniref:Uncharacterized protein n=1 Tax=Chondromyces crocatus TaxID=52 RepID=A0A0K1ERR2_CHOCO|nr:hypothetical protein [Chondromyces crocatus]AKT43600.1 uncharacterized protein CMC5_078350 [Chondromyces crocatus]
MSNGTEETRRWVVPAIVAAALLGGVLVWQATRPAAAPLAEGHAGTPGGKGDEEPRRPASGATGAASGRQPSAPGKKPPPREDEGPAPAEPMIDMPAGEPPEEGAGDDFKESGLPRALFDAKVGMEEYMPSAMRLEGAEAKLGRKLSPEKRDALKAAFEKADEEAAQALAAFRLKELSEEEARRTILDAEGRYLKVVAEAFGSPVEAVKRAFETSLER